MLRGLLLAAALFLACVTPAMARAEQAHPFGANLTWFNVEKPLTLADLKGRVVILDFWTLGCINCIHIVPTLRAVEQAYPDKVAVIGIHSPKFEAEKDNDAVADAIGRYGIAHPVVNDPDMTLWHAYGVEVWPTLVFLGPDGHVVGKFEGEPDRKQLLASVGDLIGQYQSKGALAPKSLALKRQPVESGRFRFPGKIRAVPGQAKRWVLADSGHNQIVLLDDAGKELRRFGSGTAGLRDGAASDAEFDNPQGAAADDAGHLYVADTDNHALRAIDLATGAVTTLAGTGRRGDTLGAEAAGRTTALASPWDVVAHDRGVIFANAGTHQIGIYDTRTKMVERLAGSGEEGIVDGAADEAELAQPSGLALGADGATLYFADAESSAIRKLTIGRERRVTTLVGKGLFDFGEKNGPFAQARLQHPLGLTVSGNDVLVSDTYNSILRSLDLKSRSVSDWGAAGFTCQDALCRPLRQPAGITADGADRVLVVDTNNHRVEEYRPSTKTFHTWAR